MVADHSKPTYLFVYGTLRDDPAHEMYRVLARQAEFVGDGSLPGRLYDFGEYPGAIKVDSDAGAVVGEVYRLKNPEVTLPHLDEYEGCGPTDRPPFEFVREASKVRLKDGNAVLCWVYFYNRAPIKGRLIPSGDYAQFRASLGTKR